MARRLKLDDDVIKVITAAMKAGATVVDAAGAADVSEGSVYAWIRRGEEAEEKREAGERINRNDQRCLKFLKAVRKARKSAIVRNLALITNAAPKDWRAAAWLVERMNPADYGRGASTAVQVNANGGSVQVTFAEAVEAAFAEERAELESQPEKPALPASAMVIDVEP